MKHSKSQLKRFRAQMGLDVPGIMSPIPLNLTCAHCNLECMGTCSRARAEKEQQNENTNPRHREHNS